MTSAKQSLGLQSQGGGARESYIRRVRLPETLHALQFTVVTFVRTAEVVNVVIMGDRPRGAGETRLGRHTLLFQAAYAINICYPGPGYLSSARETTRNMHDTSEDCIC